MSRTLPQPLAWGLGPGQETTFDTVSDQLSDQRIALVVAGTESSLVISDNGRVNDVEVFSLSIHFTV